MEPSRLESFLLNDDVKTKMAWVAYCENDKTACMRRVDEFLEDASVTLANSSKYQEFLSQAHSELTRILEVNFDNLNLKLESYDDVGIRKGLVDCGSKLKFGEGLEQMGAWVIEAFCPLPDLDPTEQNSLLLSLWTDLTNELQSAVTAYETYWKLNYSCTPDQFIYPSEKIDKIRSLRQSIVNYQKKIDKLPKSTTVYKRNQRYHRVKDIINNFYYQENIKNDREWYKTSKTASLSHVIEQLSTFYLSLPENFTDFTEIIQRALMFIRHSKIRETWIKVSNTTLKPHETDLEHYRYHSKLACLVESRNYNKIESLCNWSSDAYVKQEAEEAERQENDEKWWKTKVHIEVDVTGDDAELDNKMYEKMYGVEYGEDYGALFSLEDDIYEDKRENKTKIKKKTTVSLENEIVPFNINRFANLAGVELPEFCAINDSNLHHEITEDENSLLSEDDTTSFYPKINRQIVLLNELSKKCNTIATPISEVNMKDIPIFDIYNE